MATATSSKKKAANPTVKVTLSTFDLSNRPVYRVVRKAKQLSDFEEVGHEEYAPTGSTPLLDAMVEFIEDMLSMKKKGEVQVGLLLDESGSMTGNRDAVITSVNEFIKGIKDVKKVDPKVSGKGFLVVATDGFENASRKHTYKDVANLVHECEKDGWVTVFLGAGIDGWDQGRNVGVSGQSAYAQTVSSINSPQGTQSAMRNVTGRTISYLSDSGSYLAGAAKTSSSSVTEDGQELSINIADAKKAKKVNTGAYNPQDAIEKFAE